MAYTGLSVLYLIEIRGMGRYQGWEKVGLF